MVRIRIRTCAHASWENVAARENVGRTMVRRPRCDTIEGCDIEVTVTSSEELHTLCKQAERAKRETEKR